MDCKSLCVKSQIEQSGFSNPSNENEIPPVVSNRIDILLRTSLSRFYLTFSILLCYLLQRYCSIFLCYPCDSYTQILGLGSKFEISSHIWLPVAVRRPSNLRNKLIWARIPDHPRMRPKEANTWYETYPYL